jgi:TatD DNase family protein
MRPKPGTRRNEPAFLPWVRDRIAAATGRTPAEIAAATTATAERFFGLM